jgi:hypothetical protein
MPTDLTSVVRSRKTANRGRNIAFAHEQGIHVRGCMSCYCPKPHQDRITGGPTSVLVDCP